MLTSLAQFVKRAACALVVLVLAGSAGEAADWGLKEGTPKLASAGPLAFAPDGILLVGDYRAAAIVAIDTGDTSGDPEAAQYNVERLNEKAAEALGASPAELAINDLVVNPLSGNLYLSVSHGTGPDQQAALLRVDTSGSITPLPLENVPFARIELPDPPPDQEQGEGPRRRNPRNESVTDLAYADGKVLVSGLSNAAAPSTVREIPFPFVTADAGTSLEIYHGAHGRLEDYAAPRVFVPFTIDGEPNLLAGFTCTPLVKFPLGSLVPGKKVRGTTVAELGNRNRPLDMIVYEKGGQSWLLMANSSRGVMKISTENIERQEGISEPIGGGGTAGQPYETISDLQGVVQLDRLNKDHAVILVQSESGAQHLQTIALP